MKTTIAIPCNDVFSPDFESKMDAYFTLNYKSDRWGKYQRWDKDDARSALATTRPSKFWTQGILGVRSPVSRS